MFGRGNDDNGDGDEEPDWSEYQLGGPVKGSNWEEKSLGEFSSQEYKQYQKAEEIARQRTWYQKTVDKLGVFEVHLDDLEKDYKNALRFLNWEMDQDHIFPTALLVGMLIAIPLTPVLLLTDIPLIFKIGGAAVPFAMFVWLVYYPVLKAKEKVIKASDEMIIGVLYMILYMRNTPTLEGATRFAADNTRGDISLDLKRVLWETEVGVYTDIDAALMHYARKWRPYNQDFLEAIELIRAATAESNVRHREEVLQEAMDNLLEGTFQRMKKYVRDLKMPVSVISGMGVLLPVLGIILFPMIATFIGGSNLAVYLAFTYNIAIPIIVYVVIQQVLLKRPPTANTESVRNDVLPPEGRYNISIGGKKMPIPSIIPAAVIFVLLAAWPLSYYYSVIFGAAELTTSPTIVEMFRSILFTLAMGISLGIHYYFGNIQRRNKLDEVHDIEAEFPEALFQVGHALQKGVPVEIGLKKAIRSMQEMKITELFQVVVYNMTEMGMTFEEGVFNESYGALREFPSKLVESVMRAVSQSAQKGPQVVAQAMITISKYLKNIRRTQEEIEAQLSDTLSTIVFLAFVLAPAISGVALAMGTIITKAFFILGESAVGNPGDLPSGGGPDGAGGVGNAPSIMDTLNLQNAVPPEILQLVIGIYLVQLSLLIGMFYIRLSKGESTVLRKIYTGRILIVAPIIYSIVTLLLIMIFGGIISSMGAGVTPG